MQALPHVEVVSQHAEVATLAAVTKGENFLSLRKIKVKV